MAMEETDKQGNESTVQDTNPEMTVLEGKKQEVFPENEIKDSDITPKLPLEDILSEHKNSLHEIKSLIEARLQYDTTKDAVINRLSEEVKIYRDNFIFQSHKPIFLDLIMLFDSLDQFQNSINGSEELSRERIIDWLHALREELLEILYRRDILPFDEHPEVLDYKLHKTIKTIPTPDEGENNRVVKILKSGFRWNEKILRPEEVIIKKFIKT